MVVLPPRWLGVAGWLPMCGEQQEVCKGCDLAPLVERNIIVEARILVERDAVYWNGVEIDSYSNRHLNGD